MGALLHRVRTLVGQATAIRGAGRVAAAWRRSAGWVPGGPAGARMVGLITLLSWVTFMSFISLARYGGDFRALLCLGQKMYHPAALEGIPRAGPAGYDGQYYVALATDPFLRNVDTPKAIDAPAYRSSRIFVPLLAWMLALGNAGGAIIAYQFLCWALALAAVYVVARWLAEDGHSPWWALLLAPGAGLVASMMRSTLDAAAVFFVLATLWAHARGRDPLALLLAAAAVLTREMSYLVALAVAFDLVRRRRLARAAAFAVLPLLPYFGWQLHLSRVLGPRFVLNHGGFTYPFAWVREKLPTVFGSSGVWWMELFGLLAVAATTVAFVLLLARPSGWTTPVLAYLAFTGLGLALTYDVYIETWGYARILIAVPFLATLVAERQTSPWSRWSLRAVTIFYLLAGVLMARGELDTALRGRSVLATLRDGAVPKTAGRSVGPARPDGVRALYALPIANARGRSDALWRTRLVVTNMSGVENAILVELLPAGRRPGVAQRRWVTLGPNESREWQNVAGELFGFSGTAALAIFAVPAPIAAGFVTGDTRAGAPPAPPLAAVSAERATEPGRRATFRGLAYEPALEAAVRTNIGVLNVSLLPLRARIEAFDALARPLGALVEVVPPWGYLQVDDLFRRVAAGRVADGSAAVEALSPASFLSYASVIRGPKGPIRYVLPGPAAAP